MQTVTTSLDQTHDDDAEKRTKILFDLCSTVGLFDTTKAESINHFGAKNERVCSFSFCSSMPNVSEAEVKSLGLCESSANSETFSLIIHIGGITQKTDELSDRALY